MQDRKDVPFYFLQIPVICTIEKEANLPLVFKSFKFRKESFLVSDKITKSNDMTSLDI